MNFELRNLISWGDRVILRQGNRGVGDVFRQSNRVLGGVLRQGNREVGDVLRQGNRGTKALHEFL